MNQPAPTTATTQRQPRWLHYVLIPAIAMLPWGHQVAYGQSTSTFEELSATVTKLEQTLDARIGVLLLNTATGDQWAHRSAERFRMNSTVKVLICAAVLDAEASGSLSIEEQVLVSESDLIEHAPLAEAHVGRSLTLAELCRGAIDLSDNSAANLLLERLGGPAAVTDFLRRSGDSVTRLDRYEPALNHGAPEDPRDTSTPEAMIATLERLMLTDGLPETARTRLIQWMADGSYTGAFLRAAAPGNWKIADKSGAGPGTRTLVALIEPPNGDPWLLAAFIADAEVDFAARNDAMAMLTASIVRAIAGR